MSKTKMIAYIRVSTEDQKENGSSIPAQIERIQAYASLYDIEIVDYVIESKSAKSLNRPELQRALGLLESGAADGILVVKLDRLTRNVRDLGELIERYFSDGKHALMSVNEHIDTRTASGRLVLNILASVSQWEREAIGERTKEVKQHQKRANKYLGGRVPYGYDIETRIETKDGKPVNVSYLVRNEPEQLVIDQARKLRDSGMSLLAIARALDSRGLRARNSKVFSAEQIKRLVVLAA